MSWAAATPSRRWFSRRWPHPAASAQWRTRPGSPARPTGSCRRCRSGGRPGRSGTCAPRRNGRSAPPPSPPSRSSRSSTCSSRRSLPVGPSAWPAPPPSTTRRSSRSCRGPGASPAAPRRRVQRVHRRRRRGVHLDRGARVQLAIAPAGSGKTTAMRALTSAWENAGGHVIGLAPSAAAAAALRDQIDTHQTVQVDTLAKVTWSLANRQLPHWVDRIGPGTLVVIDEAGMADTLSLNAVMQHVLHRGGAVRLVGDDQQLAAIGAGGVLRDIRAQHGAAHLTELLRFADPALPWLPAVPPRCASTPPGGRTCNSAATSLRPWPPRSTTAPPPNPTPPGPNSLPVCPLPVSSRTSRCGEPPPPPPGPTTARPDRASCRRPPPPGSSTSTAASPATAPQP